MHGIWNKHVMYVHGHLPVLSSFAFLVGGSLNSVSGTPLVKASSR